MKQEKWATNFEFQFYFRGISENNFHKSHFQFPENIHCNPVQLKLKYIRRAGGKTGRSKIIQLSGANLQTWSNITGCPKNKVAMLEYDKKNKAQFFWENLYIVLQLTLVPIKWNQIMLKVWYEIVWWCI